MLKLELIKKRKINNFAKFIRKYLKDNFSIKFIFRVLRKQSYYILAKSCLDKKQQTNSKKARAKICVIIKKIVLYFR